MPEIIYRFPGKGAKKPRSDIRWLSINDLNIFNEHLSLCGQGSLDQSTWDEIYDEGTQYCVLFVDSVPAARACVRSILPMPGKWQMSGWRGPSATEDWHSMYATVSCRIFWIMEKSPRSARKKITRPCSG